MTSSSHSSSSDDALTAERQLRAFVADEVARPVPDAVHPVAKEIAAKFRGQAEAVLFYGSCLRDCDLAAGVLDFYVIIRSYDRAYDKRWLGLANRILPPNVFYYESEVDGRRIRSKYAVISLDDFERRANAEWRNVSIWGRFSQPCRILLAGGDARRRLIIALSQAIKSMIGEVLALCPPGADAEAIWTTAFRRTYGAELRSEGADAARKLFKADADRYRRVTPLALAVLGAETPAGGDQPGTTADLPADTYRRAKRRWWWRKVDGKVASLFRLIKGALTFDGGVDYLAWKIGRHSGVQITVTDWHRRHPILAGLMMFWRLRRRGAFR